MRKLWYLLMSVPFLLFSCSKEEQPVVPDSPKIEISITDLSFPDEIGKAESFDITSNVPWKIALSDTRSVPGWLQVSPMSGGAGTVKVSVTVTEDNDSYDDRNAYIKIEAGTASKVFTVTQKKKDALILTQDKIEVDAGGGKFDIQLQTNNSYTVTIPEESAVWISRVNAAKTRALETKVEKFEVKEGTEDGRRQGMIIFESAGLKDTVHVFQAQKDVLILSENECYVSNEQAKVEIDIRANIEYDVLIPSDVTWIKQVMTRTLRVDKLALSVDANESYDGRSAQVVVKDKNSTLADTLHVFQYQVNALILGKHLYDAISYYGGNISVLLKSNVNFKFEIPKDAEQWLKIVQTRGLKEHKVDFAIDANSEYDREIKVPCIGDGNTKDTLCIKQDGAKNILMDFYRATDGNNWTNKTNWGSDEPLENWYGVGYTTSDCIHRLDLASNNLQGSIPESFGKLKSLQEIFFYGNALTGEIKDFINTLKDCEKLYTLQLDGNRFSGNIPGSIQNLTALKYIDISRNKLSGKLPDELGHLSELEVIRFFRNNLAGNIPSTLGKLSHLTDLDLDKNNLQGTIPDMFDNMPDFKWLHVNSNMLSEPLPVSLMRNRNWGRMMDYVIYQNNYCLYPPGEYGLVRNIANKDINLDNCNTYDIFSKYKYTILYNYGYNCVPSIGYTPLVVDLYNKYKKKGLGVVSYHACILENGDLNPIKSYIASSGMSSFNNLLQIGKVLDEYGSTQWDDSYFVGGNGTPEVMVVDEQGWLKYGLAEDRYKLPEFIKTLLGEPETPESPYASTDFSKDGEVFALQTASVGNGINIVILGDGFVDKDMGADGKYEIRMKEAMEHFFSVEPVKTYRSRFNVYCVKAVSLNEGIGDGKKTAFSAAFGESVSIGGDDEKCIRYALKVPSISNEQNTTIITVLNNARYAGTCYMYGNNVSVAYCPIVGFSQEGFSQIIHHEVVGHGFGKLADEYVYSGTISTDEKKYMIQAQTLGWWNNVDFTNDPNTIRWNSFLANSAYTGQVGIYEGGCTYQYGVWRSTENSIMLDNTGVFNAPSRQAIYKWIMELSGETYSMEKFLEYDAINRTAVTRALGKRKVAKDFVPLAPPVVVPKKK